MRSLFGFLAFNVETTTAAYDIFATVKARQDHNTLTTALTTAKHDTWLASTGPFTLFAPTDAAFTALGNATLENLLKPANMHLLKNVLNYHVVSGKKEAKDLTDGLKIATVQTQKVNVRVSAGKNKTYTLICSSAYMESTAGNIMRKHFCSGVTATLAASNGVIHVIDKVLIPLDIVQLAASVAPTPGSKQYDWTLPLKELVKALKAADLVTGYRFDDGWGYTSFLKGDGPFTVFAPTDAAFKALKAGELTRLLKPANKAELASILKYHVVGSSIQKAALTNGRSITTLHTGVVVAKQSFIGARTDTSIEGAKITTADIVALNGIVHIVDKVLIPPKAAAGNTTGASSSDSTIHGMFSVVMVALGLYAMQ